MRSVALAVAAAGILACAGEGPSPSVLLVSVDGLRLDAVDVYGGPFAETPVIDGLARVATVYSQAVTPATDTAAAHGSLLTGRYPPRHGLRHPDASLATDATSLAESLRDQGFATAAFVSSEALGPRTGLGRGFAVHDAPAAGSRPAGDTVAAAAAWLDARDRARPFLLWVHLGAVLAEAEAIPAPPDLAPGSEDERRWTTVRYYRAATRLDEQVGLLFRALRGTAAFNRMLVAVLASHGEVLGEHGRPPGAHARLLTEAAVRIPFVLRLPGALRPGAVSAPVSLVDLRPTLLAALDLSAPGDGAGRSLLAAPDDPARPLYSEAPGAPDPTLTSLRMGGWKLVEGAAQRAALFDLRRDPGERRNLAAEHPELVHRLARARSQLGDGAGDGLAPDDRFR